MSASEATRPTTCACGAPIGPRVERAEGIRSAYLLLQLLGFRLGRSLAAEVMGLLPNVLAWRESAEATGRCLPCRTKLPKNYEIVYRLLARDRPLAALSEDIRGAADLAEELARADREDSARADELIAAAVKLRQSAVHHEADEAARKMPRPADEDPPPADATRTYDV